VQNHLLIQQLMLQRPVQKSYKNKFKNISKTV
jgi:hypothetical protein